MTKSIFTNKHKDCKTIFHLHICRGYARNVADDAFGH